MTPQDHPAYQAKYNEVMDRFAELDRHLDEMAEMAKERAAYYAGLVEDRTNNMIKQLQEREYLTNLNDI